MRKSILILLVALLSGACAKPVENGSAATFFDFVCRDCNYLQVTEYHFPDAIGRTGPVVHQGLVWSYFIELQLVPWGPEEKPVEGGIYTSQWRCPGDEYLENQILQYYRKEYVRSFEHIEYRKEGLSGIEIVSSFPVSAWDGENYQEYQVGESLIDLFDIVRIYKEDEEGYDDLIIGKDGSVLSALPDRMPLTEYLQYETKAFSSLCLYLKKNIGLSRDITISVKLDNGQTFDYLIEMVK